MTREVWNLCFPAARMNDRPRREEEEGRVAVAVALPEDVDAVALDVAGVVGIAGTTLLARELWSLHVAPMGAPAGARRGSPSATLASVWLEIESRCDRWSEMQVQNAPLGEIGAGAMHDPSAA